MSSTPTPNAKRRVRKRRDRLLPPASSWANLLGEIEEYEKGLAHIKNVVLVGIGGSSLGVKALKSMLEGTKGIKRELLFLDNVDPCSYKSTLDGLKFDETLFIIKLKNQATRSRRSLF